MKANGQTQVQQTPDLAAILAQFEARMDQKIAAVVKAEPTIRETVRQERNSKRTLNARDKSQGPPIQTYRTEHGAVGFVRGRKGLCMMPENWKLVIAAILAEIG